MRFLCQTHLDSYADKPDEALTSTWVDWMYTGGLYYGARKWRKAVPFVGCAFDLAKLRLKRCDTMNIEAVTQLSLSAVYLSNIFEHLGVSSEACNIRQLALEAIENISIAFEGCDRITWSSCKRNLWNAANDRDFVLRHLNVPFYMPEEALRLQMAFH